MAPWNNKKKSKNRAKKNTAVANTDNGSVAAAAALHHVLPLPPPLTTRNGSGWGPGGSEESWKREKDSRRVAKAENSVSSELSSNLSGQLVIGAPENIENRFLRATGILGRIAVWDRWMDTVKDVRNEGRFTEVIIESTVVIERIKNELRISGFDIEEQAKQRNRTEAMISCNPLALLVLHLFRAEAHLVCGQYQGCIDDTTTVIPYINVIKSIESQRTVLNFEYDALVLRAKGFGAANNYGMAAKDYRAACAMKRLHSENVGRLASHVTMEDAVEGALLCMTLKKVEDHARRPFFSIIEREHIERELGVGMYSKDNYHCNSCGKDASDEAKLSLCSQCRKVHYCSTECSRIGWKSGHKKECKSNNSTTTRQLKEKNRATIESIVESHGHVVLTHPRTGPFIVLKDPDTGALFESLSDKNVVFESDVA